MLSYFSHSESHLFYFYVALTVTNQIIESFQEETLLTIEQSALLLMTIVKPSSI